MSLEWEIIHTKHMQLFDLSLLSIYFFFYLTLYCVHNFCMVIFIRKELAQISCFIFLYSRATVCVISLETSNFLLHDLVTTLRVHVSKSQPTVWLSGLIYSNHNNFFFLHIISPRWKTLIASWQQNLLSYPTLCAV